MSIKLEFDSPKEFAEFIETLPPASRQPSENERDLCCQIEELARQLNESQRHNNALLAQSQTLSTRDQNYVRDLLTAFTSTKSKILAIKAVRALTSLGLKEAKDIIDHYWQNP